MKPPELNRWRCDNCSAPHSSSRCGSGVTTRELICYGRAVVNDEWPKMAKGEDSAAVTHWVEQMDTPC